jgi:carboxymethylenebutenolidase
LPGLSAVAASGLLAACAELLTVPGADHAFLNDTSPRFNAPAAATTYDRVLICFRQHLT